MGEGGEGGERDGRESDGRKREGRGRGVRGRRLCHKFCIDITF